MDNFTSKLADAKAKLPLDMFMRQRGFGEFVKASCKSPFRDEKTASWGVFTDEKGELKWKDFTTGETGDQIDFLATELGCSTKDAIAAFFEMAGVSTPSTEFRKRVSALPTPPSEPEPESLIQLNPFDWKACQDALTPDKIQKLAEWRGYTPEFVEWLKSQGKIGMYEDCPATPVIKDGVVVGCQYRTKEGPRYANNTPGAKTPALPLVIGKPEALIFLAMESPWDGFALMQGLGMHKGQDADLLCMAITRSASNHAKLAPLFEARAKSSAPGDVILVGQNDKPRIDGKPTGHDTLEAGVRKLCAEYGLTPKIAFPPKHIDGKPVKDANDWLRAEPQADFITFLSEARASTKSKLSIRSINELLSFQHTDADNYFGDRILAEGQPATILGPGGVGKSRLLLQLAICTIVGAKFLGLETHATQKPWLIIQTENSNRRLQVDLKGMIQGLGLSQDQIQIINENLFIHTIETDNDAFLSLESQDEFAAVQTLITDLNPAFVVFDPLNTFTTGDLNSDADMRGLCTAITRATKRGNPKRVPVVLHHSLTGKAGAQRGTGWDKASYGRNSKVLQAWTRSQINIIPRDPEDATKLLIACGKNNNGQMFPEIAVYFDEESRVYLIDDDYDPQAFREEIGAVKKGKAGRPPKKPTPDQIISLLTEESIPQSKFKYAIMDKFDVDPTTAWRAIQDLEKVNKNCVTYIAKKPYYSRP